MTNSENSEEKRTTNDRRKFCYTAYSPERRTGIDRRQINEQKLQMKSA